MKTTNNNGKSFKLAKTALSSMTAMVLSSVPTFAAGSNDIAEKGATWFLDGAFWVILCVGIYFGSMSAIKRNMSGALGIFLATALGAVICNEPAIVVNLGTKLKGIMGL